MFTRADRAAVGQYSRISALSVNASGQPTTHELRLSPFHYLTSGADPSGACAALAAEASAPAGLGSKDSALLAAWDLAAQVLRRRVQFMRCWMVGSGWMVGRQGQGCPPASHPQESSQPNLAMPRTAHSARPVHKRLHLSLHPFLRSTSTLPATT